MHRFEEDPVVPALGAPPGAAGPEYPQPRRPILLCHPRQHGRLLPNRPPTVTDPRTWESTHGILSPIRPHGLAIGIFNAGTSVGGMLAPPIVVFLLVNYSWQAAFVISGSIGIVW